MKMNSGIITIFVVLTMYIFMGCNNVSDPPTTQEPETWQPVQQLSHLSVRYMLKHNNVLYLSAVDPIKEPKRKNFGLIFKTTDGIRWEKIKEISWRVGPLAMHGDTLYCIADSIYRYSVNSDKWSTAGPFTLWSGDIPSFGEMIFIKDNLFIMQTLFSGMVSTYKAKFDGTFEEMIPYNGHTYAGAKCIKKPGVEDRCYVRAQYYCRGFFTFDGNVYTKLDNGLSPEEIAYPPTNSMCFKDDTLFAGFKFPGRIKYLDNGTWKNYTDTLPYSPSAHLFRPVIRTEPTAIAFVKERLFLATHSWGVMEWKKDKGWVNISKGLLDIEGEKELYRPVVFLEAVNGVLVAAYGEPGYAPWGGYGVYTYRVK